MGENIVSCETVQQLAVPWLEEQLAPAELEQIGMHLEKCEGCAEHIAKLDEIDLRPPRIHHAHPARKPSYWDDMDAQLQSEMQEQYALESSVERTQSHSWPRSAVYFLAASLLLSLLWGIQQQRRVDALHTQLQQQQREIERMERMFSSPPQPTPNSQYTVHVPARMEL